MQYRKLGKSGLEVSVVGIGGWPMGGDISAWGPVDDNESIAAIQEGLDLGITLIDTAPSYGYGHGEEVVGRAIAGRRERVVLATKCGVTWRSSGTRSVERTLKPESIRKECEASLRRLRVETIDLYQLHWPDPATPLAESVGMLQRLRSHGKIRAFGFANFGCEQLSEARRLGPIDCVQTEFSLLAQHAADELLPYCREYGIGVLACGVLARGLLTGKFSPESRLTDGRAAERRFSGDAFARNLRLVEKLREIAGRVAASPAQLALSWAIHHAGVTSALAGVKRASQVRENAGAADLVIPPAELSEIEKLLSEQDAR